MCQVDGQLEEIVRRALDRCEPALLVRSALEKHSAELPAFGSLIAAGKAAAAMCSGAMPFLSAPRGLAAIPQGYPIDLPEGVGRVDGSHPEMTDASFCAGKEILDRVLDASDPLLFLISGGASATIEVALEPHFDEATLISLNRGLLRSGLRITDVNLARSHVSAIKGGRLGERLPEGSWTVVLSDVGSDHWNKVGSGPTFADPSTNEQAASIIESLGLAELDEASRRLRSGNVPETPNNLSERAFLAGSSRTLIEATVQAAREAGFRSVNIDREMDDDVSKVVDTLYERSRSLDPGTILVAGGEPRVVVRGPGQGGRCSELAVRWAMKMEREKNRDLWALFTSSDGVDGTAEASGYVVPPESIRESSVTSEDLESMLLTSDSYAASRHVTKPLPLRPTGNNLRDLLIVARP